MPAASVEAQVRQASSTSWTAARTAAASAAAPVTYTPARPLDDPAVGGTWCRPRSGRFSGEIVAHFGDNARIASVDVTGAGRGRPRRAAPAGGVARHAVAGGAHSEGFSQSTSGNSVDNHVEVRTTVSTATDDGTAISGNYLGLFTVVLPDIFMEEALDGIQKRALCGACVRVVPNQPTVHVTPGEQRAGRRPPRRLGRRLVRRGRSRRTNDQASRRSAPTATRTPLHLRGARQRAARQLDFVRLEHTSTPRRSRTRASSTSIYDSFDYRVLAATLDEHGHRRSGPPDFPQCPPSAERRPTR